MMTGLRSPLPDNIMDLKKTLWVARPDRDQYGHNSGEEETQPGKQSPVPSSAVGFPIAKEVGMLTGDQSEVPYSGGSRPSAEVNSILLSDQSKVQPSSPPSSPPGLPLNTSPQLPVEMDRSSPASLTATTTAVDLVGSAKDGFLVPIA